MRTPHEQKMDEALREIRELAKQQTKPAYKAMPLDEYLSIMGKTKGVFAFMCSVPEPVIDRVLAGQQITTNHASQIMRELRKAFHEDLQMEHVSGLKVV